MVDGAGWRTCALCKHNAQMHDRWGLCIVVGCGPCREKADCPKCSHSFGEHMVANNKVSCLADNCINVLCYDSTREVSVELVKNNMRPTAPVVLPAAFPLAPAPLQPRTHTIQDAIEEDADNDEWGFGYGYGFQGVYNNTNKAKVFLKEWSE